MLSAIVPTHDRPEALSQCLRTLMTQRVAGDELEIVVIDDGSRADVAPVVADAAVGAPFLVRCERQPLAGLNAARNRGAAIARGELLAFLDDDTLVDPGWARALLDAFADHPCAAVAGRVRLQLAGPAPEWLAERERVMLAEYELGDDPRWLDEDPPPVGANCAVRSRDLHTVQGFRAGLDRRGRSLVSNGDSEFFLRVRASGGLLRYEPRASVIHCVPARRLTVQYFVRRNYSQGVSDELMAKLQGQDPDPPHVIPLLRGLGGAGKMICRDAVLGRSTAAGRFWGGYWAGRLLGKVRAHRLSGPAHH